MIRQVKRFFQKIIMKTKQNTMGDIIESESQIPILLHTLGYITLQKCRIV